MTAADDQPTMPPGTYYDEARGRYLLPHELPWNPHVFSKVTGQALPACPCGAQSDMLVFTTVQPITAEAEAEATAERRTNITGMCLGCARRAAGVFMEQQGDEVGS